MSPVRYTDEVQVVLTSFDPPPRPALKERRLVLSRYQPRMPIGRTSKRDPDMAPARGNAWIDSAVMSRDHAELFFDSTQKTVFLRDIGSLHGTFHNGLRLAKDKEQALTEGDIVKFGVAVERHAQDFPPCVMKVTLNYGSEMRPAARPLVFRVPDDSDMEDEVSGDEDMSIQNSIQALRDNGISPSQPAIPSDVVAIDLTSDEDLEAESHLTPQSPAGQHSGILDLPVSSDPRAEVDEALDDWEDYDSSAQSPVPFRILSPPLQQEMDASGSLSDNEPVSGFDGDMDFDSDEDFGLDQDAPSLADSLPSPNCHCDNEGAERTASLNSIQLKSPTNEEMKQPATLFRESINVLEPSVDSEQCSAQSRHDRLPSIDSDHGIQSGCVQLPSICDSMGTITSISPQQFSQKSAAKMLGEKTGKLEYFSARSFNKRLATATTAQTPQTPPRQLSRFMDLVRDDNQVAGTKNYCDTQQRGRQEHDVSGIILNDAYLAEAPDSTLLASGAKFLSSPLQEPSKVHPVLTPPELDETSAFQFEQSKKAAEVDAAASKQTHMDIKDLVDTHPIGQASEDKQLSKKRKAADISDLTQEIDGPYVGPKDELAPAQPNSSYSRPEAASPATANSASEANRPTKRIRRAAEAFGYVALGGVAVMSALIASAPTL